MEHPDSWDSLQQKLAELRRDEQNEPFLPLLDVLEPRLNAKADDRDRDLAKAVFAIIETPLAEKGQSANMQTSVGKMSGGYIQRIVAEHVQQANQDFVIKNIINVFPQYRNQLDRETVTAEPVDLKALAAAEQRYRARIKERFSEDARYYIPLVGDTTEPITDGAAGHIPPSVRRRLKRIAPEFRELVEEGREIRRVRLNSLREAVDKYPCVILLGDPGCGKTTTLEHLADELAGENGPLPLPLRLSGFEPDMTVEDFIGDGWAGPESADHWNWSSSELAAGLGAYLEAGKLLFLFDGLNEMPHEGYAERTRALRRFISRWSPKGNRFVVTCRVLDYGEELSGLKRVEIQPFSDEQIKDFLRQDLPENWKGLWRRLSEESNAQRSLLELARNPFMLSIMVQVFNTDGRLGRNRSELMDRFTQILIEELARPRCAPGIWLDADVQRAALAQLAFEIQTRPRLGTTVKKVLAESVMLPHVKLDSNWPTVPSPAERVIDLAASAHIIEMTGDRSSLRFYHQLLQEYFAGREMLKRNPDKMTNFWRWPWLEKDMPKWVRPLGNYDPLPSPPQTNWEETTMMAAGLMPENDDQLLRAVMEINPVLAGRCLYEGKAEVGRDTRQTVIERLLTTVSNPKVALRVRIAAGEVLGNLGDPRLSELVTIPEGPFLMGDDEDNDAKPQHEVFLPSYRIGKYPVTYSEFKEFIESGGYEKKRWWTDAGWSSKKEAKWTEPRYWDDTRFNKPNQPVVGVCWYECLAYCRWRSAESGQPYRLPNEAEWEKAARGTDGRQYPWGEEFEPERLNSSEGDQIVRATSPVGIYPAGVSPNKCWDMAGNVSEWTSSLWGMNIIKPSYGYPYQPDDRREKLEAGDDVHRVLRGGSWYDIRYFACCSYRFRDNPSYRYVFSGFRVVVSPIFSASAL